MSSKSELKRQNIMAGRPMMEGVEDLPPSDYADFLARTLYGRNAKARELIGGSDAQIFRDADDEILRLRTLIDGLMKAVEPFAEMGKQYEQYVYQKDARASLAPLIGDLRRAREAYLKAKGE